MLMTRRRYIYQGWNVIAEYVNGARNKTYVWGEDLSGSLQGAGGVGGLLLEHNCNGDYLPVYDGNRNIIAYKNNEGRIVSTYAYDPFGNVIAHAGMEFTYKFSTKPQDELSRLYYYGYRFYQPTVGRWINRDPIREGGNRNEASRYTILVNNCTNIIDYNGLLAESVVIGGGVTIGLAPLVVVGAVVAGIILVSAIVYISDSVLDQLIKLMRSRAHSDPYVLPIINPGIDHKNCKCKPCPPNGKVWSHKHKDGSTNYHRIEYYQAPYPKCTCFPKRVESNKPIE